MPPETETRILSEFAAGLQFGDLPAEVVAVIKKMILDSLGCALAATTLGDGCAETLSVMQRLGGREEATILGTGSKVSAPNAAFANGALVHALNYDPIGAKIGHLGVNCLVAPLAMAEAIGGKSGKDLIVASAVAAEITARINDAISRTGRRPSEKFLSGQLLTYFGAAAGAGKIIGLDTSAMHSALGLALMQMAGSRQITQDGDPPAKAIYGAFPNQAGVISALLAEAGLGADIDVFGEPAGLYPVIYDGDGNRQALTDRLGETFVLTQVGFKPWPTSDQLHPAIEAAVQLRLDGVEPADVTKIEVTVHPNAKPWCEPLDDRRRPANAAAAANSIPYCTAKALLHGDVTLSDFTKFGLADPDAHAVADRLTCNYEDGCAGAALSVTLSDGTRHRVHIEQSLGSSARPIAMERLRAKFRDCCAHAAMPLPETTIDALMTQIESLEELQDISMLVDLTTSGHR